MSTSIMTGTLDHLNNPSQTLNEIQRVLVSAGYFLLLESVLLKKKRSFYDETHSNQFTMTDLKGLLNRFEIEKLSKYFLLSQFHIPSKLLTLTIFHKMLADMPGIIGRLFNYYEVLVRARKK